MTKRRALPNWTIEVIEAGAGDSALAAKHLDAAMDQLSQGHAERAAIQLLQAQIRIQQVHHALTLARQNGGDNGHGS